MAARGNDGNFGLMGTSMNDGGFSAGSLPPNDFQGYIPAGFNRMGSGPIPTTGDASNAIVTHGLINNEPMVANVKARKWDNKSDDSIPEGAIMFSYLEAPLETQPHATMGSHCMANWALETGSVCDSQLMNQVPGPDGKKSCIITGIEDPRTHELFVFRPENGGSSAGALVRKIRPVGRKGPDDSGTRDARTPAGVRVFPLGNLNSQTVRNCFAPDLKRLDRLFYLVKEVLFNSDSIKDPMGKPSSMIPDTVRWAIQLVPFSNGVNPPYGCLVSDSQYLDETSMPKKVSKLPGAKCRDYIAFQSRVKLRRWKREIVNGKFTITEEPIDDYVDLNLYQIGEVFQIGTVWEDPARAVSQPEIDEAVRNHTALEMLPTARIALRPCLL